MVYTSRFVDEDALHASVPGCPLAWRATTNDEHACATCKYNVAFPKTAQIGCHVRTPADVVDHARSALKARNEKHARVLEVLRRADAADAAAFSVLADAWLKDATTDDEREVASTIARFARAASLRPVEILR